MPALTSAQLIATQVAHLQPSGSFLLAIDGFTCAGKSTITDTLANLLDATVVRVDDLSAPGVLPWEWQRFLHEIWIPIRDGQDVIYRKHHWTQCEPGEQVVVRSGKPVILEGVQASLAQLREHLDFIVWVETALDIRIDRATERGAERFKCWSTNWRPVEEAWERTERPRFAADLVVSGD